MLSSKALFWVFVLPFTLHTDMFAVDTKKNHTAHTVYVPRLRWAQKSEEQQSRKYKTSNGNYGRTHQNNCWMASIAANVYGAFWWNLAYKQTHRHTPLAFLVNVYVPLAFHSFHLVELLVCRFLHIFRNCQDYMSNKWK